jgi:uncharacterized SAM-binding protein YcdF (DUF218 family)
MFLFLSKLLPMFLYPVGLSCVLLVIAMLTFWKHPRIAAIAMGTALGILLFSSNTWVSDALQRSLESQYRPLTVFPKADAIVILGGATRSPVPPRVWPEVMESGDRILYGAKLYREGRAPKVILSGGRIDWKDNAAEIGEAQDMRTLLTFMGVPESAMLLDSTSLNTYQNAVNVKAILKQAHITGPLLLVTSAKHMPRSMAIFKKLGMTAIAAPTDYLLDDSNLSKDSNNFLLKLLPDAEALFQTTVTLKEYVGLLVYRLKGWA